MLRGKRRCGLTYVSKPLGIKLVCSPGWGVVATATLILGLRRMRGLIRAVAHRSGQDKHVANLAFTATVWCLTNI